MKSLIRFAAAFLFLFAALNLFAACTDSSGEEVCERFFGSLCPSTHKWCGYEDCLGRNFGEEAMFIAGGIYPKLWIAESDGTFEVGVGLPCNLKTVNGVTIISYGESPHCSMNLLTDEHMYIELFATVPEIECVAWAECKCY